MGMFLNSRSPFGEYSSIAGTRYFVDKSAMIDEILEMVMGEGQKYFCITRPRRFGKSIMANMIGSFFGRAVDGKDVFDQLDVAKGKHYQEHLNSHDVIYIDLSRLPRDCKCYEQYIQRIQNGINDDLAEAYPALRLNIDRSVWDNLQIIYEHEHIKFIFVMDEWDAIFHKSFVSEDGKKVTLSFCVTC